MCIISSNDFPLVSGMKTIPKMALRKQIKPSVIMHLNRPKFSRKIGKANPSTNRIIHMHEMTNAKQICRIWNGKKISHENHEWSFFTTKIAWMNELLWMKYAHICGQVKNERIYLLWEQFCRQNERNWDEPWPTEKKWCTPNKMAASNRIQGNLSTAMNKRRIGRNWL